MNAKERRMFENWQRATMRNIYDAYERPSLAKVRAYERCIDKAIELGGWDIRVPSKNTFGFTLAFLFRGKDCKLSMFYATKDNDYVFEIGE